MAAGLLERCAECCAGCQQRAAHAELLRPLPRKQEGKLAACSPSLLRPTPPHAGGPRKAQPALRQPPRHRAPTPRHATQNASGATPPSATTADQSASPCRDSHSPYRPACARSAASSRPDTNSGNGSDKPAVLCSSIAATFGAMLMASDRAGASSSTTCAFVPLNPNALTPARRGRAASRGHAVS